MKHVSCRFPLDKPVMSVLYLSILSELILEKKYPVIGCSKGDRNALNPNKRISPELFLKVINQSLAPAELAGIGFQFGQRLDLSAAGTSGQLFMSSPNLGVAFDYFLEFFPMLSLSMEFESWKEGKRVYFKIKRLYRKNEPEHVKWFASETLLSSLLSAARRLSGKDLSLVSLDIPYSKPPHSDMYTRFFGCPVSFSCDEFLGCFDFTNTPILTSNKVVMNLKVKECEMKMQRLNKRFSIQEQIVTLLKKYQPEIPSQELVAERLNLSQSSLYRKLKDANTSYQKIIDDFRRQQALTYLNDTDLPIYTIAENLGFSDASNFRRAFKKWTGLTPKELRSF